MKDTRKKINGLLALAIMGVGFTMAPTMTSALTLPEPSAIAPDALDLTNILKQLLEVQVGLLMKVLVSQWL